MADNPALRGEPDRSRIAMHEEHEVRYWTQHLGVSRDQLQAAVDAVGQSADAVRAHLADRPGSAATTRFGMEDGDNTDTPATGVDPEQQSGGR